MMERYLYYLFDKETKTIKRTNDSDEFSKWFRSDGRILVKTTVGDLVISTVALGLNCGGLLGDPLIFETMIHTEDFEKFAEDEDGCTFQERYSTYDEAMEGHRLQVARVRRAI